jgi:hypothetical protein
MKFCFKIDNVLVVFAYAKTFNAKIVNSNLPIVQTYAFSKEQYEYLKNDSKATTFGLLDFDGQNCLDCPLSKTNGYKIGKCYTHKYFQLNGLRSTLKSVIKEYQSWDSIPDFPSVPPKKLVLACSDNYIRFGTYGETVFIPLNWYQILTSVASSWTGYTHQWHKCDKEYSKYLMASANNIFEDAIAKNEGWRTFVILKKDDKNENVLCPADRKNVTCQKCALCSGTTGKGKKSINIFYH